MTSSLLRSLSPARWVQHAKIWRSHSKSPIIPTGLCSFRRFAVSSGDGTSRLTHVDKNGDASMVDVSAKEYKTRTATAEGTVLVGSEVHGLLAENISPGNKGDVFGVAQLAGIMAAKRTADIIPLCHALALARVDVKLRLCDTMPQVLISATAKTSQAQTGVEMEALTAVSVAALTVYDMCKAASKDMTITDIRLVAKTGGNSGDYRRQK